MQVSEALQGLPAHKCYLLLSEGASDMIDVLQGATTTVFHANPQLVTPEVRPEVGHYVRMPTVLHHEDLLLDDTKVIPRLQFYHLDGSIFTSGETFSLKIVFYQLNPL